MNFINFGLKWYFIKTCNKIIKNYIYLISTWNNPNYRWIWSSGPQISWLFQIKIFKQFFPWVMFTFMPFYLCWFFGLSRIHWSICSLTSTHITFDGYPGRVSWTNKLPSFEPFHHFVKFPLAITYIDILNCHSAIKFASFHSLRLEQLDHRSPFMCSVNGAVTLNMSQYYHYLKDNENQLDKRMEVSYSFISVIFFSVTITSKVK